MPVSFLNIFGEVLHVHDAAMSCDGLDLEVGGFEQLACLLHALFLDVVGERLAHFLFEDGGKVARADPRFRGQHGS